MISTCSFRVFFNIRNHTKHKCDCFIPSPDSHFTWNPSLILANLRTHVFPTSNSKLCQKKEPVELKLPANAVALSYLKQEMAVASGLIWVPEIATQDSVSTFLCLVVRTIHCSTCSRAGCSGNIWQIKFLQIWWEAGARGPAWLHVHLSLNQHDVCPSSVTKLSLDGASSLMWLTNDGHNYNVWKSINTNESDLLLPLPN